ncbi:hypothetical protein B0T26DRAFT_491000 [Lasiosphaeria miniovina]|uniref:Uncharacterized protein n=1 Tax=Lasiosphaeria miniovina TaxID=1954250 RepID=A0AA40DGZ3_9PEZI|nr:uncharacterized protein B0T26DRAFT_491000 [Lasiosphaeria miniovina]KAK0703144.1 hypothetical protein B0T26DRAFT_491000 [Lasiosphaeria miniovina]
MGGDLQRHGGETRVDGGGDLQRHDDLQNRRGATDMGDNRGVDRGVDGRGSASDQQKNRHRETDRASPYPAHRAIPHHDQAETDRAPHPPYHQETADALCVRWEPVATGGGVPATNGRFAGRTGSKR